MKPNPNRTRHLTREMRLKGAATKRARLEEEFGLPFERARKLRAKYYAQGYEACRWKHAMLVEENRALRARVEGLELTLKYRKAA